jgi:chromo domain-containing protein 1
MSDAEFLDYQTKIDDQHQDAVNFADVLRERRLAKRTEKRKKIAKLGRKSALFIAEKQKRAPPARAKDQSSSESSDEVDDNSDDSLLEEVANNPKRRVPPEPKPPQKAQAEQANQPARSARQTSSEKAPTTLPSRKPVERRTSIASPSTEPVPRNTIAAAVRRKSTSFEATSPSFRTTAALPSAAASSKPTEKGYKTPATAKSANPIRMLMDKPKEPARKAWNTTDKHFTTLHFRANAMKRGRIEGTPDPSSLEFVNGKPDGLVTKPSEAGALHRVDETDANPENRRETGRRTLLNRNDDLEDEPEPISALQPFERSKIPEICFDWHNGHCNFPAEKCRRLHRRTDGTGKPLRLGHWNGAITPKYATPPQTCWWWLRGEKGCSKSAEDCIYAHENTGWLIQLPGGKVVKIDPSERPGATNLNATISAYSGFVLPKNAAEPVTCHYWFLTRKGCSKSAEECKYAHVNTGLLGNSEGRLFDRIDRSLAPVFMRNQNHPTVPIGPARVPDKEKTCFFWNEYKCKKGEACFYKHEYTGIVAEPPPNFTYQGKHLSRIAKPNS